MPHSRPAQPPADAASAGEWRAALRREAGDSARLAALVGTAQALPGCRDAAAARDTVLDAALALCAARDGALLGLRGERWQVLASRGRALPPGASLPGAWAGPAAEVLAARAGRGPDWWLGPRQPMRALEAAVPGPGGLVGVLSLAIPAEEQREEADLAALTAFAAMAAGCTLEPAPAPRRARRDGGSRLASLTRRERQVLALLPRGLTNPQLAEELGISRATVKIHVERILHKLALSDRTQAAVYAARHGMGA